MLGGFFSFFVILLATHRMDLLNAQSSAIARELGISRGTVCKAGADVA